ncbi:hypothetical protein GBF38_018362, partial [Nibea albiflora]
QGLFVSRAGFEVVLTHELRLGRLEERRPGTVKTCCAHPGSAPVQFSYCTCVRCFDFNGEPFSGAGLDPGDRLRPADSSPHQLGAQ